MVVEDFFGQQEDVEWRLARDLPGALKLARSREQHELALMVHRQCMKYRLSYPDLAARLEQRRESLWSKLTGRSPAREADLILWAWLTGERRRSYEPAGLTATPILIPRFSAMLRNRER
jgi:hypothetical protein